MLLIAARVTCMRSMAKPCAPREVPAANAAKPEWRRSRTQLFRRRLRTKAHGSRLRSGRLALERALSDRPPLPCLTGAARPRIDVRKAVRTLLQSFLQQMVSAVVCESGVLTPVMGRGWNLSDPIPEGIPWSALDAK